MPALALRAALWALPWIVQATLVSAAALALLAVGRRWSPRARHAIVAVAFLSFAVPPFLDLPLPSAGGALSALAGLAARSASLPADGSTATAWALPGTVVAGALLAWAAGALAILGAILLQAVYLARLRRRAWPPRSPVPDRCLRAAARHLGIARPPALFCSDDLAGPCLTGLLRPAILLPAALVDRLQPAALELILAHELAHLRQRDVWLNGLRALLCALWWPHPLSWILAQVSRRIREEACDDAVLSALETPPADYARALLETARAAAAPRLALVSVGALGGSALALGKRLKRMGDPRTRRTDRLSRLQVAAIALLSVAAINGTDFDVRTVRAGDTVTTFVHLTDPRSNHARQHRADHRALHPPGRR